MFISSWFQRRTVRQRESRSRPRQSTGAGRRGRRLAFEQLEGRAMLSGLTRVLEFSIMY